MLLMFTIQRKASSNCVRNGLALFTWPYNRDVSSYLSNVKLFATFAA